MKQAPYFIPCTKIKFKALKQRHETVTFIEENIVETLPGISLKKNPKKQLLGKKSRNTNNKAKLFPWDYVKLRKKVLHSKGNTQQSEKITKRIGENILKLYN